MLNAFTLADAVQKAKAVEAPMSRVADESLRAYQNYRQTTSKSLIDELPLNEYLVVHIRNSLTQTMRQFDYGMTALASIGATAPFIGLYGLGYLPCLDRHQRKRPDEYCCGSRSDWRSFGIDCCRPVCGDSGRIGVQLPQSRYKNHRARYGRICT